MRLFGVPKTPSYERVEITPEDEPGKIVNGVCSICGATSREETCIVGDRPTEPRCPHWDLDDDE